MMAELTPTIRAATPADAPALADLHVRAWQWAYRGQLPDAFLDGLTADLDRRAAFWRESLATPAADRRTWLAEVAGRLVGFADTGPCRDVDAPPDTAELNAIYLDRAAIGQGIGRALLAHATDDLRPRGYRAATLWVLATNARARRFYEAAGWYADGAARRSSTRAASCWTRCATPSLSPPPTADCLGRRAEAGGRWASSRAHPRASIRQHGPCVSRLVRRQDASARPDVESMPQMLAHQPTRRREVARRDRGEDGGMVPVGRRSFVGGRGADQHPRQEEGAEAFQQRRQQPIAAGARDRDVESKAASANAWGRRAASARAGRRQVHQVGRRGARGRRSGVVGPDT